MTGVSFIVTVYNKAPFLPFVLPALFAQVGGFDREFVIIDDGSTDGSRAEIDRLAGGRADVRVLAQANQGPSVATNRGIAAARYPFVKLLDADDVLLPQATAALLDALSRHPDAVLAYGGSEPYRAPEEALARLARARAGDAAGHPVEIGDRLPMMLRRCPIGPSTCLLRTAAAREAGGCDERVFVQDYSLFLRLAAAGSFVALGGTVALCAAEAAGRINDSGAQVLHDINLTLAHFLAERPLPPALAREAARRAVDRACLWARRREGAGLLSRWSWLRLLARLPLPLPPEALVRQSCTAFTLSRPVRRSAPAPVPDTPNGGG